MKPAILIDLETLDTKPTAVITEFAAIKFDPASFDFLESFTFEPDIFDQFAAGRTFSADTIAFHRRKGTIPKRTGSHLMPDTVRLIQNFIDPLDDISAVYIQGKDFDGPILDDLFRAVLGPDHGFPVPYWQRHCSRDAFYYAFRGTRAPRKKTHHALEDCRQTLLDLRDALQALPNPDSLPCHTRTPAAPAAVASNGRP